MQQHKHAHWPQAPFFSQPSWIVTQEQNNTLVSHLCTSRAKLAITWCHGDSDLLALPILKSEPLKSCVERNRLALHVRLISCLLSKIAATRMQASENIGGSKEKMCKRISESVLPSRKNDELDLSGVYSLETLIPILLCPDLHTTPFNDGLKKESFETEWIWWWYKTYILHSALLIQNRLLLFTHTCLLRQQSSSCNGRREISVCSAFILQQAQWLNNGLVCSSLG